MLDLRAVNTQKRTDLFASRDILNMKEGFGE